MFRGARRRTVMRWLGFALLCLMAPGCAVHVVQQPAAPVLIAEPAFADAAERPVRVRARPALAAPAPEPERTRRTAAAALPSEARPKRPISTQTEVVKPAEPARPPRQRPPRKPTRNARFKLEPNDVAAVKTEPAAPRRKQRARSASVAQSQKHALDLGQ